MRYVKCGPIVERSAIVALLIIAGSAASVRADIVFSNVDTTACGCGFVIIGQNYGSGESLAEEFTPAGDYSVTGAEAQLHGFPGEGTVNFAVYSNAGNVPGVSLDALGSVTVLTNQEGVFSANTPANPLLLLVDVPYWLVLTPGTADTAVTWESHGSSFQPFAGTSDTTGASGWTTNVGAVRSLQFQINGTAAPEPASAWLCLAALGIVGMRYMKPVRSQA